MGHEKKRHEKKASARSRKKKDSGQEKKEIRPDSALTAGSGDQKNHQKMTPKIPPKSIFSGPSGPISIFFGPFGPHFHVFRALRGTFFIFRALRGLLPFFSGPAGPFTLFFRSLRGLSTVPEPFGIPGKKRIPRKKKGSHGFGPQIQKKKGIR